MTGQFIRDVRTAAGLTQDAFAEKIGLIIQSGPYKGKPNRGQVCRWEKGRNLPSRLWREKIQKFVDRQRKA